ncbi:LacI family DNA-binding transcriptional regulator [Streptomyces sodiiphilus]|uniref:LacI family DNA-binding transcriptional regulator n=1 Tax=Streptomyces sodiiphilus TaxID=226217 RepID=A0ABN2PGH9_9ACTN
MAVTIRDVAQAAGVHVSTVSRTFSAPHMVNADTRERVLAAATQLGYRPNQAARALTTGRTHNLGLIVADIANPFFPPLIKAAQAYARERGYHVFVADTDEDPQEEQELIQTLAKQVDGVVLVSPRLTNHSIERLGMELPFVVVNRRVKGLSAVLMDVGSGAVQAVRHLTSLGHRRLALLGGPRGSWTSEQMRKAATAEAAAAGAELTVIGPNSPTERGGTDAAPEVLGCRATGVIAYNDLVAIGLIEGLAARGVEVPAGMSVVGVDDTVAGRLNRPKLTTVAMPTAAAGRTAVDLLLQAVDARGNGAAAQTTLETSLVVRESTAAVRPGENPPAGAPEIAGAPAG